LNIIVNSEKAKANFVHKLKTHTAKEKEIEEEDNQEGGGNYWITSTSSNVSQMLSIFVTVIRFLLSQMLIKFVTIV